MYVCMSGSKSMKENEMPPFTKKQMGVTKDCNLTIYLDLEGVLAHLQKA